MAKRLTDKQVDWLGLERDYRAGIKSDRQLEADYGISRGRIKRRAEREGWQRNLQERINNAAKVQLQQSLASAHQQLDEGVSAEERERQIVECAAATQVELVNRHRGDLAMIRGTTMAVFGQLNDQVHAGYIEVAQDDGSAVKLPLDLETVAKTLNNVTTSYQRIVNLERQAFGLDDKESQHNASSEVRSIMQMVMSETDGLPGAS